MVKKFVVDKPLLELNGTLGEGERSSWLSIINGLVFLACRVRLGHQDSASLFRRHRSV